MQAVGLHFGHDASATLIDRTGIVRFLDKERRSRVKHALSLSADDLREVLAGVPAGTPIGLSTTQNVPLFLDPEVELSIEGAGQTCGEDYFGRLGAKHQYRKYAAWMADLPGRIGLRAEEDLFPFRSRLNEGFAQSYQALGMTAGQFPALSEAMHRNGEVTLDGRSYPARFYQHHYLHAYYAAWVMSPSRSALVITGDGGVGPSFYGGGVYFWTPGQRLLTVTPTDGWIGSFYTAVSVALGFEPAGGAGKLMGLAPYGRPLYFTDQLVGTQRQVSDDYRLNMAQVVTRWLAAFDIDPAKLPRWDLFQDRPPPLVADIAASAQLVLEKNIQELARAGVRMAQRAGFSFETVILSGGVALNCPANSNLAVTLDRPVLVPPAVNDEGLSIGAAVAAYFDGAAEHPAAPASYAEAVYIGTGVTRGEVREAAARHGYAVFEGADAVERTARLLLQDELVGLCAGRAEVGPRALGHRSILANPNSTETWAATNRLKRREPWRPFAPAVLWERSADYFDRGPAESRYMLFNYRCNTKRLPAITHYDHSARVQHVSAETGLLYDLLLKLEQLDAPPVLLNTSFNGPGAPIVDSAEDAFSEAARLGLEHILTEFGLYSRRGASAAAGCEP
jgi:carbamoyltransferase